MCFYKQRYGKERIAGVFFHNRNERWIRRLLFARSLLFLFSEHKKPEPCTHWFRHPQKDSVLCCFNIQADTGRFSGFPRGFDIIIRRNSALNFPELVLMPFDTVADQHKNMAVEGTPLILRDKAEFIEHFLLDTDGYAFDCHSLTSKIDIQYVYFTQNLWYNSLYSYTVYLQHFRERLRAYYFYYFLLMK